MSSASYKPVAQFYAGKTLFITGGTGFVGKVLLEKILHSLPDVERIYVLVREKQGRSAADRLEQLFQSPIFAGPGRISRDVLKAKVFPIHGDITLASLGLSDTDRLLIVDQVNIVFHSAASVRFDNSVSEALKFNYVGTKSVADLCQQIKRLDAFVYISTCFSNCHLDEVEEKIYKTKITGEQLMALSTSMPADQLDRYARAHFFEGRPNSYTFTKALAENYVADTCQDLPVAIVRLPVVVSPIAEPEPGFTDTIAAINYLVFTLGMGSLRSYRYDPATILQVIPVDHVVSGLLVVGLDVGSTGRRQVRTINMALRNDKKNVGGFMRALPAALEHGLSFKRIRPLPDVTRAPWLIEHAYKKYVLEYFYAIMVDIFGLAMLKKPYAFSGIKRLSSVRDELEYFLLNSQLIKNEHYEELGHLLDSNDQNTFNIRIADVNKIFDDKEASFAYVSACIESFMKYKLRETTTAEDIDDRRKFTKRLQYQETIMMITVHASLGGLIYLAYRAISFAVRK